jgi:hypothetical protein
MKKFLTFVFALTIVFYLSNVSTFAQGRGTGNGPAVSGGHGPDTNSSTSDHGKSTDHANTTHTQTKSANNTKLIDRINTDTKFRDRLNALLPTEWTTANPPKTLADAAAGFTNQGRFVSFLHVSKNLGLNYTQWTEMRDKLAAGGSLGKCIHDVKPELSQTQINVQVQTAEKQAKEDLKTNTTS